MKGLKAGIALELRVRVTGDLGGVDPDGVADKLAKAPIAGRWNAYSVMSDTEVGLNDDLRGLVALKLDHLISDMASAKDAPQWADVVDTVTSVVGE